MMANIVKTFAGNRYAEPAKEAVPAPKFMSHADDDEQEAQVIVGLNRLREEVKLLRAERARLQSELNVQLMRNRDLEEERTRLRTDLEIYRRYSVEVKTHLQTIVDVARRANDAALEAGEAMAIDQHTKGILEETERDVREIAAKFAPEPQPSP